MTAAQRTQIENLLQVYGRGRSRGTPDNDQLIQHILATGQWNNFLHPTPSCVAALERLLVNFQEPKGCAGCGG